MAKLYKWGRIPRFLVPFIGFLIWLFSGLTYYETEKKTFFFFLSYFWGTSLLSVPTFSETAFQFYKTGKKLHRNHSAHRALCSFSITLPLTDTSLYQQPISVWATLVDLKSDSSKPPRAAGNDMSHLPGNCGAQSFLCQKQGKTKPLITSSLKP